MDQGVSKYVNAALRPDEPIPSDPKPVGEFIGEILKNDWVNSSYKHMVLKIHRLALCGTAGQMFNLLCPSLYGQEVWLRRPMSIYEVDPAAGTLSFLYKVEGRGTKSMALLCPGDEFNVVGPLGVGFELPERAANILVVGRGVGLATLAPLSRLAAERGVGVTAILSARSPEVVMSRELFESFGGTVVEVLDSDDTSNVEHVREIIEDLISAGRVDAMYTCGSARLLKLLQGLGKRHAIPGQVAMEQVMVCGFGACHVCMRTFRVNGELVLRRVCRDGPVFDIQEACGW